MGRFFSICSQILSKKRKYYKWHYLIPMFLPIPIISLMREWGDRQKEAVDGGEVKRWVLSPQIALKRNCLRN